jgi:hypothetical protein
MQMRWWCEAEDTINYGHLDMQGRKTKMTGRCLLYAPHREYPHRFHYHHEVLDTCDACGGAGETKRWWQRRSRWCRACGGKGQRWFVT